MSASKKTISLVIAFAIVFSAIGCGSTKTIDGIEYNTYGLFNKEDNRNENVKYRLIIGNIVWSIILCETIVAPIYFIGFSMYEPIRKASKNDVKGMVD